ncbi:peptidoglycan DD-metalloendopeptidase family protein [Pannonibacter sp. Pt2-lr]
MKDYGQSDDYGGLTEGQTFATRPGAQVTAPGDGWVVYSGPFRSFGQLLILNAGDGYHVLLAGMDRIDVELGQFVLAGEPVGVMGSTQWASASAYGLGSTSPVLYVEFRKDGSAIDPTPGGPAQRKKRLADDTESFSAVHRRTDRRCGGHNLFKPAHSPERRGQRSSFGHLPSAEPVWRCVRAGALGLCRGAG